MSFGRSYDDWRTTEPDQEPYDTPSPRLQFDCDCNGLLTAISLGRDDEASLRARMAMRKARHLGLYTEQAR